LLTATGAEYWFPMRDADVRDLCHSLPENPKLRALVVDSAGLRADQLDRLAQAVAAHGALSRLSCVCLLSSACVCLDVVSPRRCVAGSGARPRARP
jgi:hypothetical protein